MEALNNDAPKLSDMVMCGDHPALSAAELSPKDIKMEDKEKEKQKDKPILSYAKITPSASRTEALPDSRARILSEHTLRAQDRRRRMLSTERERADGTVSTSNAARPILQAFPWSALGSFRWPPYLLCVWVLVLVLTHALHCLVTVLERALPAIKGCIQYFRSWTEETWKNETEVSHHRLYPIGLALLTVALYAVYMGLYALHAVVVWSIEPLNADTEDGRCSTDIEAKVINYVDDVTSKTSASVKQ